MSLQQTEAPGQSRVLSQTLTNFLRFPRTYIDPFKLPTTSQADPWFDLAFGNRVPITVNNNQVPSTQTDFPMLVDSTIGSLVGKVQSAGQDIRYVLPDLTELKYEIQFINDANGKIISWMKVPSLANFTKIFMYYNNGGATDNQDKTAVWPNYDGVYHWQGNFLDSSL